MYTEGVLNGNPITGVDENRFIAQEINGQICHRSHDHFIYYHSVTIQ